jgi:hypothetical protein
MNAARLCALLGALLIGGGCGQKGALYLPDRAPRAVPATPASATPAATSDASPATPPAATPDATPAAQPAATPDATPATPPAATPDASPADTPADDEAARRKTPSTPDPTTAR